MGYLIDTNVLSEMRKGTRGNPQLVDWTTRAAQRDMFLSVLIVGEVRRGIEGVRRRDAAQADALEAWLGRVSDAFEGRILPVTRPIAETWGRLATPDPIAEIDGLLAATAIVHGLTLVTRNTRDVARTGVRLLNPFEPSAK
jgi:predicted nucleic acid-binding protein